MSSTTGRAVEPRLTLFRQLARAHPEHDRDAIAEAYAPDTVIYELSPPLN
jgi:hypothetical protein